MSGNSHGKSPLKEQKMPGEMVFAINLTVAEFVVGLPFCRNWIRRWQCQ